jgi:hypothetical protein
MKRKILAVSLVFASAVSAGTAWANGGSSGGNGGDAVVCRTGDGSIRSAELLDFYEAKVQRGFGQDLGNAGLTALEKVDYVLSRLARYSPERAERYRVQAHAFFENAKFVRGIDLVDIPDSEHMIFPRGCAVEQIVIQKKPELPQDKLYLVNADLWDRLSKNHQAGLILHEVIYTEAMEFDHPDSRRVRYFNSVMSSSGFDRTSYRDFFKLIADSWMNRAEIFGVVAKFLFDPKYKSEGGFGSRRRLVEWHRNELVFKPLANGRSRLEFDASYDDGRKVAPIRVRNGMLRATLGRRVNVEFAADGSVDVFDGASVEFVDAHGNGLWEVHGTLDVRGSRGAALGEIFRVRRANRLRQVRTGRSFDFRGAGSEESGMQTLSFERGFTVARIRGSASAPVRFDWPQIELQSEASELLWDVEADFPTLSHVSVYGGGENGYLDGVCRLAGSVRATKLDLRTTKDRFEVGSFSTSEPATLYCSTNKTVWFATKKRWLQNCAAPDYRKWVYPPILNGKSGNTTFETGSIGCGDRRHFAANTRTTFPVRVNGRIDYQVGKPFEFVLGEDVTFLDPSEVLRVPRRASRTWLDVNERPAIEAMEAVKYLATNGKKVTIQRGAFVRTDPKLGLITQ